MSHRIYVHRTPKCWMADLRWTPDAEHIADILGTCWIPTAFTPQAPFERVKATLEAKNPGATVVEGMPLTAEDCEVPRDQYDMKAHAKLIRVRKAAYEASYWLESGTRRAQ